MVVEALNNGIDCWRISSTAFSFFDGILTIMLSISNTHNICCVKIGITHIRSCPNSIAPWRTHGGDNIFYSLLQLLLHQQELPNHPHTVIIIIWISRLSSHVRSCPNFTATHDAPPFELLEVCSTKLSWWNFPPLSSSFLQTFKFLTGYPSLLAFHCN